MKIKCEKEYFIVEFEQNEMVHHFAGFNNIFEVKNRLLSSIEEEFDKEVARLLIEGSFRKYKN